MRVELLPLSVGSIRECLMKPPWYPLANADGLQRPVLQIYACRNSVSSTLTPPLLLLCRRRPRTWLHNKAVGDMPILDGMSAAREESILRKWDSTTTRRSAVARQLGSTATVAVRRTPPMAKKAPSSLATRKRPSHGGRFLDVVVVKKWSKSGQKSGDPETAEPRWARR